MDFLSNLIENNISCQLQAITKASTTNNETNKLFLFVKFKKNILILRK